MNRCPICNGPGNRTSAGFICSPCSRTLPTDPVERDLAVNRLDYQSNPHLAELAERLDTARRMCSALGFVGNEQLRLVRSAADKANKARTERFKTHSAPLWVRGDSWTL